MNYTCCETLSVADICGIRDLGTTAAYDLIRCERIKSIRIGHQIRVPKDALLQFLQMADN